MSDVSRAALPSRARSSTAGADEKRLTAPHANHFFGVAAERVILDVVSAEGSRTTTGPVSVNPR